MNHPLERDEDYNREEGSENGEVDNEEQYDDFENYDDYGFEEFDDEYPPAEPDNGRFGVPRYNSFGRKLAPEKLHHFHIEEPAKKEDIFDGNRAKFEEWTSRLNRAIKKRNLEVESEACTDFIMSRMEGAAGDWAENWETYESDGISFIDAMYENFGVRSLAPYKAAIENFTQKRGELLRDYKSRFQTLVRRLDSVVELRGWKYPYDEEDELTYFISGLEEESPILFEDLAKDRTEGRSWWDAANRAIEISDNLTKNRKRGNHGTIAKFSKRPPPSFDMVQEVRTLTQNQETTQTFQAPSRGAMHRAKAEANRKLIEEEADLKAAARQGDELKCAAKADFDPATVSALADRVAFTGDETAYEQCHLHMEGHTLMLCKNVVANIATTPGSDFKRGQVSCYICYGAHLMSACPKMGVALRNLRQAEKECADLREKARESRFKQRENRLKSSNIQSQNFQSRNFRGNSQSRNPQNRSFSRNRNFQRWGSGQDGRPYTREFPTNRRDSQGLATWKRDGKGSEGDWLRTQSVTWPNKEDNKYLEDYKLRSNGNCSFHYYVNHNTEDCDYWKHKCWCVQCGGAHFYRFCGSDLVKKFPWRPGIQNKDMNWEREAGLKKGQYMCNKSDLPPPGGLSDSGAGTAKKTDGGVYCVTPC